ncbi:MAG: peptidoglycan-binding protein [Hyphomicrobiales bacterium]|nr:peptidoglycan-binding protein [Hyphomicrobiales bacterium]
MNSKRTYLDAVNTGRQRRSYASLEQLNRSLESLEQRIERNREEISGREPQRRAAAEPRARAEFDTPAASARDRAPQGYAPPPYAPQARAPQAYAPQAYPPEPRGPFEPPYKSLARDIERVRHDEDGVVAFGKIAGELKGLREELRHQMASSLHREFDGLRKEFQQVSVSGGQAANKLGLDVERLSDAVQSLGERGDDRTINMLRLEVEQMKSALDSLAREETVLSVDRRWDDFGRRFDDFEHRLSEGAGRAADAEELAALAQRVEQINQAVGNLPESLSIRPLEEKVRTLAGALDHFIERQDGHAKETFAQIEVRLDEISRAIVGATVAAQQHQPDPEPFERIEARISALARQIEEVSEDRPGVEMLEHLQGLARRVDELAARSALPDEAIERLAYQISVIADKVDHTPAMPDVGEIFTGIEQRFDVLSSLFERRQDDALEQGNMLFRELERRLNEVAERIDNRQTETAFDSSSIMKVIDARFSELAATLDTGLSDAVSEEAIKGLESRLEGISKRLDQSATQFAGLDSDLVRSLEAQVSGLSQHLAKPSAPLPEFVDISPRLKEIEKSIADSRESVIEAARSAAETAARALAVSQPESGIVSAIADEVKALETLTRRSDERNSKTFEAIHDTLLKIVDRMGSLEREVPEPRKVEVHDAPSIDADDDFVFDEPEIATPAPRAIVERTPAQAAAAAAIAALGSDHAAEPEQAPGRVRSMLGGLTRAFGGKKEAKEPELAGSSLPEPEMDIAPSVDLDAPLDPKLANRPLEPGSGAPDLNAIMKRVRDERSPTGRATDTDAGKADFIAAARRAAQAAAAESDVLKRKSDVGNPVKALRLGDLLKSRRKTVLMGATALMTALAGLQLGKAYMSDPAETADAMPATVVVATKVAPVELDPAPMGSTAAASDAGAANPAEAADVEARIVEPQDATMEPSDTMATQPDDIEVAAPADTAQHDADAGPMEGVQIAAVSPVMPVLETVKPLAAIDVPADAGPLPLREAATGGDSKALFEIATRYAEGRGGKPDMAASAQWYEKSAELGFAPAQYRIGNMYEKGIGVTRDLAKASKWYQQAAALGNASAMHNLAVLYAMGADGHTDNDAAAVWFVKAAELGVKDSQFNLGILSAKGVGVKQSLEESYKWFALVAKTGDKDAASKRDEIAKALRPEQLERARAAAELWKPHPLDAAANTVDIPAAWQESAEKTASIDMTKAIKSVQQVLNKSGYDAGSADGVMGDKTKTAIAQFQKDNGMAATGQVDETLVRTLLARN